MNLNKSFINKANKNSVRNFDAKKLDPIQMTLLRYGIGTIRERETFNFKFNTKNNIRIPDLFDPKSGIVFEHDTVNVHGELGYSNQKTKRRNDDYRRAEIPFVVINEDLCRELELNESHLAIYLYYHKLMELE